MLIPNFHEEPDLRLCWRGCGITLFDLAFIWHRYIRNSVAVDALSAWNRGREVDRSQRGALPA